MPRVAASATSALPRGCSSRSDHNTARSTAIDRVLPPPWLHSVPTHCSEDGRAARATPYQGATLADNAGNVPGHHAD
jgi:hypothetical protein